MAFGHGLSPKTHDFRAIPLGVGECTAVKAAGLTQLRDQCLRALRHFGELAFTPEPLAGSASKRDLTARLLAAQKAYQGFNKAYLERCRTTVIAAVAEQNKRYAAQLLGRLRHAGEEIPAAERKANSDGPLRRYWYVPLDQQEQISAAELADLTTRAPDAAAGLALFKAVIVDGDAVGLTANQVAVVREIHRQVQERHRPPAFGGTDTVVSLPLDYRVLSSAWRDLPARLERTVFALLADPRNVRYQLFLDLAHPTPGQPRLRVPLSVDPERLEALFAGGRRCYVARGLTLVLGPNTVAVRLTVAQPKTAPTPLSDVRYLLARDFGQKNTTTLSLLKLEQTLDADTVAQLQTLGKEAAHRWLTEHALPGEPAIVARYRHSGQGFLRRIAEHATHIDTLRSEIDLAYPALEAEKKALGEALGLLPDAEGYLPRLEMRMAPVGHPLRPKLQAFFRLLSHIQNLKGARRDRYRRIAAIKRAWFGYLANIERHLAQAWQAAVVEEDLTYTAIERESSRYKGRAFNRVMNHAARGQYARVAHHKHAWNGIPVVTLPNYYTSTTCFRHGLVEARFRQAEVFSCPNCRAEGRLPEHADEHAADTLAVYALLQRKLKPGAVTNTPAPQGVGSTVL